MKIDFRSHPHYPQIVFTPENQADTMHIAYMLVQMNEENIAHETVPHSNQAGSSFQVYIPVTRIEVEG